MASFAIQAGPGSSIKQPVRWIVSIAAMVALASCGGEQTGGTAPVTLNPAPSPTATPTSTPTPTPTATPNFTPLIAAVNRSSFANVYIAVGTRSGKIFEYQKGTQTATAITPIASASKLFSGAAIMRLVDAGVMNLDDNPQRYLPYWTSNPTDPRSRVTLQHLLSFTSGFNRPENGAGCITDGAVTLADCARDIYTGNVQTTPGSAFSYGPDHLQIAAAMAESATGKSWTTLFREQVANPVGMTATFYSTPSASNPRIAGGVTSTANDSARLLQAMLDGSLIRQRDTFIMPRTAGLVVVTTPDASTAYGQWLYAFGAWRECDDTPFSTACTNQPILSSPGAFGWTPWVDFNRGYWGLIATQAGFSGSVESVRLEQELQPLITAALLGF